MVFAVGLMSGTSLDGIDAALVEIEGTGTKTKVKLVEFITYPFTKKTIDKIKDVFSIKTSSVEKICSLNFELGYLFGNAVKEVCKKADFSIKDLNFVASHGQTIYHLPSPEKSQFASTLQIGESAIICEMTKTTVISDFRTRDMALNGQGAPIVPYSEFVLYQDTNRIRLLQNIGGIGNITIIPPNAKLENVVAFDTGPGNMIINALCEKFYEQKYDKDGQHAANGKVNENLLKEMMDHPFIRKKYPKTTGREEFGSEYTETLLEKWQDKIEPKDFVATATMFTAKSIVENAKPFIDDQTDFIIGGGGSYNKTLVRMIQKQIPNVLVKIQEEVGFSSEAKEAIAMVILGNQTLHHLPSNVPNATGADKPAILGKITYYD
ncbi:anhydro-N-acetylmuramic acid kinase AnmK [Pisciglobus halotolerans]|uniref:Anhydro-N-acetylmuramic acid kinase n=1 Tax=Pisciglobus halotolerans TaxID=745365 RepID=A0A1I3AY20_9LACT|nr:anhydro-N-acetylmuramic acid kinase AnmK [Pisciglobus halotolerans]SFH54716.1 anhydro-N-acetylmuramic acid kinase [Pisciglobus halotolerans]